MKSVSGKEVAKLLEKKGWKLKKLKLRKQKIWCFLDRLFLRVRGNHERYLNNARFVNNWALVDSSAEQHIVGKFLFNKREIFAKMDKK